MERLLQFYLMPLCKEEKPFMIVTEICTSGE